VVLKQQNISVDLFCIGNSRCELPTLALLSTYTGGETFFFPEADPYK
jgi:hypothetical protein